MTISDKKGNVMTAVESDQGKEAGVDRAMIRRTAASSMIGTTVESFDFFAYGTASALVFGDLFFPDSDPLVGTLLAFATFGSGFIARPIGSFVFGHLGDRVGRKPTLILTLLVMGLSTVAIGLLPTYGHIGVWAPILLVALRVIQGFSLGGELGGAALLIVEHAPPGEKGRWGSWAWIGTPAGLLLCNLVFLPIALLPDDQLHSWGWRVPFLLSIVLITVGYLIRRKITESPVFEEEAAKRGDDEVSPTVEVMRHPAPLLRVMGAKLGETAVFYALGTFSLVYIEEIGVEKRYALWGVLVGAAIASFAVPYFGRVSDRIGRRPVYGFGAAFSVAMIFVLFVLFDTKQPVLIIIGLVAAFAVGHASMYGAQAAFFAEQFEAKVRYSGVSIGLAVASVLGGGFTPFIATALLKWADGSWLPVAAYVGSLALISVISVWLTPETVPREQRAAASAS